jgi:hypothetical protein
MKIIDEKRLEVSDIYPSFDLITNHTLLYAALNAGYTHVQTQKGIVDIKQYDLQRKGAVSSAQG